MSPPNATTPSKIQTIQQNIGYNQNLLIQESGGNVGIGLTTTQAKLHVGGATIINNNTT